MHGERVCVCVCKHLYLLVKPVMFRAPLAAILWGWPGSM